MGKSKLSLSDAIKHYEEVAEEQEMKARMFKSLNDYERSRSMQHTTKECEKCASEHRQLAEWLKKLKAYEDGIEIIKEQMNDLKGCDMWDTANGMAFALELLGVKESEDDDT